MLSAPAPPRFVLAARFYLCTWPSSKLLFEQRVSWQRGGGAVSIKVNYFLSLHTGGGGPESVGTGTAGTGTGCRVLGVVLGAAEAPTARSVASPGPSLTVEQVQPVSFQPEGVKAPGWGCGFRVPEKSTCGTGGGPSPFLSDRGTSSLHI